MDYQKTDHPVGQNRISINLPWLLLVWLPAFFLAAQLVKFGVNVPRMDELANCGFLLGKILSGKFTPLDLLFQHVETRQVFPRLIFLGLAWLTHWNILAEIFFTFLLAIIFSINVFFLARGCLNSKWLLFICLVGGNLLIFSPLGHDIWLYGFQMVYLFPIALLSTALVMMNSRHLGFPGKFWLGMILCTVSTFSMTNGALTWLLVLPALLVQEHDSWKKILNKNWYINWWVVAVFLNAAVYLFDFHFPVREFGLDLILMVPWEGFIFFLSLISLPLNPTNLIFSILSGLAILICWLIMTGASLFVFLSRPEWLRKIVPWVVLGVFGILTDIMVMVGRLGYSLSFSLPPHRYAPYSVPIFISLIGLLAISWEYLSSPNRTQQKTYWIKILILILLGLAGTLPVLAYPAGLKLMAQNRKERLNARAVLVFSHVLPDRENISDYIFPDSGAFQELIFLIEKHGYFQLPLIQNVNIVYLLDNQNKLKSVGFFDGLHIKTGGRYSAFGWAVLPLRQEPADAVLLTYENQKTVPTIFKVIPGINRLRPDVVRVYKKPQYAYSGWTKIITKQDLPVGRFLIKAYSFDALQNKAYPLIGRYFLNNI